MSSQLLSPFLTGLHKDKEFIQKTEKMQVFLQMKQYRLQDLFPF